MIRLAERLLKKLGWIDPFDEDDMLNAQIEDTARDYRGLIEKLHQSFYRRLQTNQELKRTIQIAKNRTNSFADFEGRIRGGNK